MKTQILLICILVCISSRQLRIQIDQPQCPNTYKPFYTGKTDKWQYYSDDGIMVDIDLCPYKFKQPPMVFTSLSGITNHWTLTGMTSIYFLTKDGFRVYLRSPVELPFTVQIAKQRNLVLNYLVFPQQ